MAKESFYANGTIKIKNADDVLVPFYPNTKSDCVYNYQTNRNLSTIISQMENDIEAATNSGGVKTIYEPDDNKIETYAESQSFESMVVAIEPEHWQFTVDTRLLAQPGRTSNNATAAVPFSLYQQNLSLTVNWGDGTTSTMTRNDYTSWSVKDFPASEHTYATPGIYTIKVYCSNFKNLGIIAPYVDGVSTWGIDTSSTISKYALTMISIDKPLPKIRGSYPSNSYVVSGWCLKEWDGTFEECPNLERIPSDLFDNNLGFTSFHNCFAGCVKLKEIPNNLFKSQTEVTSFTQCFNCCYALETIPPDLFRYCTKATSLVNCFNNASGSGWGGYVHHITDFEIYVGSPNVTDQFKHVFSGGGGSWVLFVPYKSDVRRIVHCPAGSATYDTFSFAASDMNITVLDDMDPVPTEETGG